MSIEEPFNPSISDSPSILHSPIAPTDYEELAQCLHTVSRLPTRSSSQYPLNQGQRSQAITEKNTSKTGDYARELAIACWPKLPPWLTGIGAGMTTSNALAISFGLYTLLYTTPSNPGLDLLERATEQFQAGNLEEAIALAKSIPTDSSVYQESVTNVQQWRTEWNQAAAQFKVVEQAFQEERWRDVLEEAHKMPDIAYWQHKLEPFIEQAKPEMEGEAQQLLQQAYQQAAQKDFAGAIALLKQIPQETPTGSKIQPKLKEYAQKQQIKAEHLLQQAYQLASQKDFNGALKYLSQVPEDTPTYETARAKMTEYARKQAFQAEVELQVQLNNRFQSEQLKISKLPQRSKKSLQMSRDLNPGNQLKEVNPNSKVKHQKSKAKNQAG